MVASAPEIYACLEVTGSFDPAELSALLAVTAKTGRVGDPLPTTLRAGVPVERQRTTDWWHYSTAKRRSYEWNAELDRLLDVVRAQAAGFVDFCDARALSREVHLVAHCQDDSPNGSFTANTISELGRLGCGVEIDFYWP